MTQGRRTLSVVATLVMVTGMLVALALPASAGTWAVSIADFRFAPSDVTVKAGDTVVFGHDGVIAHTVTAVDGSFDSGVLYGGDDYVRTFSTPGDVDYFCDLHPWMRGTIEVQSRNAVNAPPADTTVAAAAAWSMQLPADSASTAIIGRDDVFADALASGPAQAALGAPLLLTDSDSLSSITRSELERLGVTRAMILGGTGAVSSAVEQQIGAMGIATERVAGASRIDTAIAVAERVMPGADSAILARAFGDGSDATRAFADAIGAGSAGGQLGAPVVLTERDRLNAATKAYLMRNGIDTVYVAGGDAAVSESIDDELDAMGMRVIRVAGPNRTITSLLWAFETHPTTFTPLDTEGPKHLMLVDAGSGDSWASGLAASLHARDDGLVIAFTEMIPDVLTFAINTKARITCGPGIDDADCELVEAASNTPNQFEADASPVAIMTSDGSPSGEGDPSAVGGIVNLFPTTERGTVCSMAETVLQEEVMAAHVHRVSDGSVVYALSTDRDFGDLMVGCTTGIPAADVSAVFANPTDYYINVHTESFPAGAIAGTVFNPEVIMVADSTGDQEVPPSGAEGLGLAFVMARADTTEFCTQMLGFGASGDIQAAHIHQGERGTNGDVLVTLPGMVTLAPGFAIGFGCSGTLDQSVYDAIVGDSFSHYVNFHTEANPAGEWRGQLVGIPL